MILEESLAGSPLVQIVRQRLQVVFIPCMIRINDSPVNTLLGSMSFQTCILHHPDHLKNCCKPRKKTTYNYIRRILTDVVMNTYRSLLRVLHQCCINGSFHTPSAADDIAVPRNGLLVRSPCFRLLYPVQVLL